MQQRVRAALALIAVLLLTQLVGVPPAAAAPGCSANSSKVTGLVREAHPVVLVHGWRGGPMQDTRSALETKMGRNSGFQFLLFDYRSDSDEWAASEKVAGCLANYLRAVGDAHLRAGGDGRVYVVAHSMGGLAARFAVARGADPVGNQSGRQPVILGGLVTLDTPHQGTPWGNSGLYADLIDWATEHIDGLGPVPQPNTRASRCLAAHSAGRGLPSGCAAPPYLPADVPVHQVEGTATFTRRILGFLTYDVIVGGDGIVPSGSSAGYLGSASGSTTGRPVSIDTVPCRWSWSQVADAVRGVAGGAVGALLQMHLDGNAMDAIQAGRRDPGLLELHALTLFKAPCGHLEITTMPEAITSTADALRDMATPKPVTRGQMLSLTLTSDHSCSYADDSFAAGATLIDGKLEGPSGGFISVEDVALADVDSDGVGDGVAHLVCSSGRAGTSSALVIRTAARSQYELPYTADAEGALTDMSVYRVKTVVIEGGTLTVDAYGHRPDDATCCPSADVEISYDIAPGGPEFREARVLAGEVTLGLGGTVDDQALFTPAGALMAHLTERLGPPDDIAEGSMCEAGGPAGRRVTWEDLTVLFVDDGAAYLAGSQPAMSAEGPIAVGWEYWLIKTGTDRLRLRTAEGIGLGSSPADVRAAYPDAIEGEDFAGRYADVFRGDFSGITFTFADDEVVAITSGGACGE